ncbi:hypothetical protein AB0M39_29560 [Streptomyces sp. NPDC051907]|uniref:hypothetical protein n=1 Tax=Streptomyces sp. NPDC051907 TaxID=3155284 RepID=UPI003438B17C
MGVCIEVMIVDWDKVEAMPASRREEMLIDAACGDEDYGDLDEEGWIWPSPADADWYGRYAFRRTNGSYKPHFWAGERWEHIRDYAAPRLRTALDRFTAPLFWDGFEYFVGEDAGAVPEREGAWHGGLLVWRPPEDVAALKGFWGEAEPQLKTLREPFDQHAAVPQGWICDFESFAELLMGWGEVVVEADRRGWGLLGLRC